MKVVILGAGGQVGRALVRMAAARRTEVVAFDRAKLDVTDGDSVEAALGAVGQSVVVNLAGYTDVDGAEGDRVSAFRVNCEGAEIVARACRRHGFPLVHLSTDYVFDGQKAQPYVESDPVSPLNAYGESKEVGERAVSALHERHVILRTSWVFGPDGQNFLKSMIRLAETRDEWGVVADQLGTPTSTADLAAAILMVSKEAFHGHDCWGLYHLAGSEEATRYDFACMIVEAWSRRTGRLPRLRRLATSEYPTPARRPQNSRLDSRKFEARFGFRAEPLPARTDEAVRTLLGHP